MSLIYDGSDLTKGSFGQFCWAAVGVDNGSAWVIRFMNYGFKIND